MGLIVLLMCHNFLLLGLLVIFDWLLYSVILCCWVLGFCYLPLKIVALFFPEDSLVILDQFDLFETSFNTWQGRYWPVFRNNVVLPLKYGSLESPVTALVIIKNCPVQLVELNDSLSCVSLGRTSAVYSTLASGSFFPGLMEFCCMYVQFNFNIRFKGTTVEIPEGLFMKNSFHLELCFYTLNWNIFSSVSEITMSCLWLSWISHSPDCASRRRATGLVGLVSIISLFIRDHIFILCSSQYLKTGVWCLLSSFLVVSRKLSTDSATSSWLNAEVLLHF